PHLSPPPSPAQPDFGVIVGCHNALAAGHTTLATNHAALGEQLAHFKNIPAVDHGAAILAQLNTITTRLNGMDARLNDIDTRFTTRLNNMDARFTTRFNDMDARFTTRLDGITASVNALRASTRAT